MLIILEKTLKIKISLINKLREPSVFLSDFSEPKAKIHVAIIFLNFCKGLKLVLSYYKERRTETKSIWGQAAEEHIWTQEWRSNKRLEKMHNEKIYNLYSPPNIIYDDQFKEEGIDWVRSMYGRIQYFGRKDIFGRPGHVWEIWKWTWKKESGRERTRFIWLKAGQAVLCIVINFSYNFGSSLSGWATISFSRRTLLAS